MIVVDVGLVTVTPSSAGPMLSIFDPVDPVHGIGYLRATTPGDWPHRALEQLVREQRRART